MVFWQPSYQSSMFVIGFLGFPLFGILVAVFPLPILSISCRIAYQMQDGNNLDGQVASNESPINALFS